MSDLAVFRSRLSTLLKFGFGGSEVARDPQDDTDSPVYGPMPAGAETVVDWFIDAINTSDEKSAILFLVGAPEKWEIIHCEARERSRRSETRRW